MFQCGTILVLNKESEGIMQSEKISELTKALIKVQKAIKPVKEESSNPFFKSKYADLTAVWEACREALSLNGFAVPQTFKEPAMGQGIVITTTLLHESGEWISGDLLLPATKQDPQAYGSAITYGRRYALSAMVGICPEDDDGNEASGKKKKEEKKETPKSTHNKPAPKPDSTKFRKALNGQMQRIGAKKFVEILGGAGYTTIDELVEKIEQEKTEKERRAKQEEFYNLLTKEADK